MKNVIYILKLLLILLLAFTFTGTAAWAKNQKNSDETKTMVSVDSTYMEAKKLMLRKDWQEAIRKFKTIVDGFPTSQWTDDSLYWLAYCQNHYSRGLEDLDRFLEIQESALEQLDALIKKFPQSTFRDDAKILKMDIAEELVKKGFSNFKKYIVNGTAEDGNMEMKLIAINSLLNTDKEKAFPILEKIIRSSYNPKLKEKALFVLTQTGDARVVPLLIDVAKKDKNIKVRKYAIFWLGQNGNGKTIQTLLDIYRSLGDSEEDVKLKNEIVFSLSQLKEPAATDTLIDLYKKEPRLSVKKKILFWLSQSKDKKALEFLQSIIFK